MITDLIDAARPGLKVTSGASGRSRQSEPQLQHHIVLIPPELQQELRLGLYFWGYAALYNHTSVHEVTDLHPGLNMNSFPLTAKYLFIRHTAQDCG